MAHSRGCRSNGTGSTTQSKSKDSEDRVIRSRWAPVMQGNSDHAGGRFMLPTGSGSFKDTKTDRSASTGAAQSYLQHLAIRLARGNESVSTLSDGAVSKL